VAQLRELIREAFHGTSSLARSVRTNVEYPYEPLTADVEHEGLLYRLILNESRARYVGETLAQIASAQSEESKRPEVHAALVSEMLRNDYLHRPPLGATTCRFDALKDNELYLADIKLASTSYALIGNKRPWGHEHFLLVAYENRGQAITDVDLRACFEALRGLGPAYEATFAGVLAGASVLHFHLQLHRGSAPIWDNLEANRLQLVTHHDQGDMSISITRNWPASALLFRGRDDLVAQAVSTAITDNRLSSEPRPYNIGIKLIDGRPATFLFFRSVDAEKPESLNRFPYSYGRFSFNEMGGSMVMLAREGFDDCISHPAGIPRSISEMSYFNSKTIETLR
jgi:hypothetical protein